jgi:hypothetical protein
MKDVDIQINRQTMEKREASVKEDSRDCQTNLVPYFAFAC